ncbi:MAG: carboxylesterase family protein, partial [Sphingobium sp.]
MRFFTRAIAMAATAGTVLMPVAASAREAAVVAVETGKVAGEAKDDQVVWLGIPYAAPPTGQLRWKAPRPAAPWAGVRQAVSYGASCPQPDSPFRLAGGTQAEDCLFINIWAPKGYRGRKLPVMVSIHGGAYVIGSGNLEDTTSFTRDGVIMVSMNYRLGRLGQFGHPALTAEDPNGALGSYMLMDQIAALQWVQRNIAGFGGDPRKVTIFGCSAGGTYTNLLMGSPKARGLFHGAIAQSDPFSTPWPRLARTGRTIGGSAEDLGARYIASVGLPDATAADLRALPVGKLISPLASNATDRIGPVVDGQYALQGVDAFEPGNVAHVPYVNSINSWEGILAQMFDTGGATAIGNLGPEKDKVLALYTPEQRANPAWLASHVMDDTGFRAPQRVAARGSVKAGNPTWALYFDYVAEAARAQSPMGSAHCSDAGYVFERPGSMMGKIVPTEADMKVARTMHAYYVNFAKTGNPNGSGLPQWPQYGASETLMEVRKDGFVPAVNPDAERMKVLVPVVNAVGRGIGLGGPVPTAPTAPTMPPPPATGDMTVDMPLETLAANAQARAILEKHVPTITTNAMFPQYKGMSLKQLAGMSGGKITPELIDAVAA